MTMIKNGVFRGTTRKSCVVYDVKKYAWVLLLWVLSCAQVEALHIGRIELLSKETGTPFLATLSLLPRHSENVRLYTFHAVLRDMSRIPASELPLQSSIFRKGHNWFLRLAGGPLEATHAAVVRVRYFDAQGHQHSFSVFLHPTHVAQAVPSAGLVHSHPTAYGLLDRFVPTDRLALAPLQVTHADAMMGKQNGAPGSAKERSPAFTQSSTDETQSTASDPSVAANLSGQTITLTQPILIAQLAKMHRVPDISDTRMAAYIHLFNPTLRFSPKMVGLIQADQALYLPSVAEVMALNQQLWNSYKRMIVNHVRRTTRTRSFVLSSQGQVTYGRTTNVVVPVAFPVPSHGNRVQVDRAVLSHRKYTPPVEVDVEDRMAQKVSDEQSQAQLKELDTKINRLMADVAKREQRLKQEELLVQQQAAKREETRIQPLPPPHAEHWVKVKKHSTAELLGILCGIAMVGIGCVLYLAQRTSRGRKIAEPLRGTEDRSVVSPPMGPVIPPGKKVVDHVCGVDLELSTSKLLVNNGGYIVPSQEGVQPPFVSAASMSPPLVGTPRENVRHILSLVEEKMAKKDDALAEKMLIDAINRCPQEPLLYVKLFEIYAMNQLIAQAFSVMGTIHKLTLGEGAAWQMLLSLSKRHGIDHPYMAKQTEATHPTGKGVPVKKVDFANEHKSVVLDQEV